MFEGDPLKIIIVKITMAVVAAIIIINFFKPIVTIAAENAICNNCDAGTAIILTAIVFFGCIGVAMYKLMGVFSNG